MRISGTLYQTDFCPYTGFSDHERGEDCKHFGVKGCTEGLRHKITNSGSRPAEVSIKKRSRREAGESPIGAGHPASLKDSSRRSVSNPCDLTSSLVKVSPFYPLGS